MATQRTTFTSPKGIAMWPWLNTPDTKFNPDGEYKVNLRIPTEEAEPLMGQIRGWLEEYKVDQIKKDPKLSRFGISYPYEEEIDDQGNLTGFTIFKFKQKAKIQTRDGSVLSMKVALFDAKRNPTTVRVGGGSVLKVHALALPYAMNSTKLFGMSLKPMSVQIINLTEVEITTASSIFDEEDGYEADLEAEAAEAKVKPVNLSEELDDSVDF